MEADCSSLVRRHGLHEAASLCKHHRVGKKCRGKDIDLKNLSRYLCTFHRDAVITSLSKRDGAFAMTYSPRDILRVSPSPSVRSHRYMPTTPTVGRPARPRSDTPPPKIPERVVRPIPRRVVPTASPASLSKEAYGSLVEKEAREEWQRYKTLGQERWIEQLEKLPSAGSGSTLYRKSKLFIKIYPDEEKFRTKATHESSLTKEMANLGVCPPFFGNPLTNDVGNTPLVLMSQALQPTTLKEWVLRHGPEIPSKFSPEDANPMDADTFLRDFERIREVLTAKLKKMHDARVFHGDLHWEQLVYDEITDEWYIIDFDLSYRKNLAGERECSTALVPANCGRKKYYTPCLNMLRPTSTYASDSWEKTPLHKWSGPTAGRYHDRYAYGGCLPSKRSKLQDERDILNSCFLVPNDEKRRYEKEKETNPTLKKPRRDPPAAGLEDEFWDELMDRIRDDAIGKSDTSA